MYLRHIITILAFPILFCACTTQKDLAYFENIKDSQFGTIQTADYQIKIKSQDELMIIVSSEVPSASTQFNTVMANPVTGKDLPDITSASIGSIMTTSSTTPKYLTYTVHKNGDIDFPVLGEIHVEGMTIEELKNYLKSQIENTVRNPLVFVYLVNFKVKVIGEVKEPQTVNVTTEKFSIIDALSACGDMTEYGKRDNVIIMREQPDGTMGYFRLNLHDTSLFTSPYYYLQQNDIVYVEPNQIKQDNSKYNQNNSFKLSTISTIVSAASVIASLVIALTVK